MEIIILLIPLISQWADGLNFYLDCEFSTYRFATSSQKDDTLAKTSFVKSSEHVFPLLGGEN